MFEKDAEEYRLNLVSELREKIQNGCNCKELIDIELAFQKGAEFGYNKANEWHYVEDGDLPTHTRQILVYLESDDVDIECYGKGIGWKNHLNEQIKAWKEIVLPKEIE